MGKLLKFTILKKILKAFFVEKPKNIVEKNSSTSSGAI
jgi:hypothetical protein